VAAQRRADGRLSAGCDDERVTPPTPDNDEQPAPYGTGAATAAEPSHGNGNGRKPRRRTRVHHLMQFKQDGRRWAMLTAYDQYAAAIFDEAGIPVLLVGDSAGNNVFGYPTTLPVTVDEMLPLVRAVSGAAPHALIVADLPFGSYERSPEQAFDTAVRFMKEGLAHAVKFEGGRERSDQVRKVTEAGIPVFGHIGFTPQSEHALGGYRVQGRGDEADRLLADAVELEEAGAVAVVLEMVPGELAGHITQRLSIPTIGIGAGPDCDAQVLVWQDMAGLRTGKAPRFVRRYADLAGVLGTAARAYAEDVEAGTFPTSKHTFES